VSWCVDGVKRSEGTDGGVEVASHAPIGSIAG
jgi:hypothetical protein